LLAGRIIPRSTIQEERLPGDAEGELGLGLRAELSVGGVNPLDAHETVRS